MAVMTSETTMNFAEKAQLPDTISLAEKPVNGDAPHYDALFDESSTKNGISNGMRAEAPAQADTNGESETIAAEDTSAAAVENVEGGMSGVAAHLPSSIIGDATPPATEPLGATTEPASVEPTLSDVRDELLPADPAQAIVDAEGPEPGAPSPTPINDLNNSKEPELPPSEKVDPMDISEDDPVDATIGRGEGEMLLDEPEAPTDEMDLPQVSADMSSVVTTIPAPSTEEAKPASPQEATTSGHVRQREEEEDDEAEPAAKRAKTESADEATQPSVTGAAALSTDSAPVPETSAPAPMSLQSAALPMPARGSYDSNPITHVQTKFLLEQIRKAKKTKSAMAYLYPVDYNVLNIPSYPTIVTRPMDLKTMEEKLKSNQYDNADDMMADFEQMVHNSQLFNGSQHPIAQAGQSLRAYFIKCVSVMPKGEAAKAPEPKTKKMEVAPPKPRPARQATIPIAKSPVSEKPPTTAGYLNEHGMPIIRRDSSAQNDRPKREIVPPKRDLPLSSSRPKKKKAALELKFCENVVNELHKKKYASFAYAFLYPVDPVALNIPGYLKIIKKPMDFGSVLANLKTGQYQTAKECYQDCKLVFNNCYKFNPPTDEVYKMGKMLEEVFDTEWAKKEQWIAHNMPPSEPATEDEDEEEEEEEEEIVDPNLKRMQEIQAQIAALSQEAMTIATTRRASPKAAPKKKKSVASAPKAAKPAAVSAPKAHRPKKPAKAKRLTLDQKREVSEGIANLDEAKMRKAVQIIRNGVPSLANVQDDELELDIDEIPEDVVYKLWEFVRSSAPKKDREPSPDYMDEDDDDYTQRTNTGGSAGGRRKNKPMKAQEQEERIRQLQQKLKGEGESASPSAAAESYDAGGSEAEDSESSEEE